VLEWTCGQHLGDQAANWHGASVQTARDKSARQRRAGKPLDPRRDQYEWKALLAQAGFREARWHDPRHAAAPRLLLLGVQERAVMDVMGWSSAAVVKRYARVTARLRRGIAARLNAFLWTPNEAKSETDDV
jgi:site-specific recombinase XerD